MVQQGPAPSSQEALSMRKKKAGGGGVPVLPGEKERAPPPPREGRAREESAGGHWALLCVAPGAYVSPHAHHSHPARWCFPSGLERAKLTRARQLARVSPAGTRCSGAQVSAQHCPALTPEFSSLPVLSPHHVECGRPDRSRTCVPADEIRGGDQGQGRREGYRVRDREMRG